MIKNVKENDWMSTFKWKSLDFMILFLQYAAIKSDFLYYSFIFVVNFIQLIIYFKVPFLCSEAFRTSILFFI